MQQEEPDSVIAPTAVVFTRWLISVGKLAIALLTLLIYHSTIAARADSCPTARDEISTDRPDVTNSSLVVPAICGVRDRNGAKSMRGIEKPLASSSDRSF